MTQLSAGLPTIDTIEELVRLVSLSEVRPYEFSGRATAAPSETDEDPVVAFEYAEGHSNTVLEDRFRFHVTTADAEYLADVAAIYTLEEPAEVPAAVRADFAERIGFMTVFPFLRESLFNSATRLGRRPPLVNLMRPGDFKIAVEPDAVADGEAPSVD